MWARWDVHKLERLSSPYSFATEAFMLGIAGSVKTKLTRSIYQYLYLLGRIKTIQTLFQLIFKTCSQYNVNKFGAREFIISIFLEFSKKLRYWNNVLQPLF